MSEGASHLHDDAERSTRLGRPLVGEVGPERPPFEELECHQELVLDLAERERADDVGMVELGEHRHLVREQAPGRRQLRELRSQHLERDATAGQPLFGLVHLPHPALTQQPNEPIIADRFHRELL